MLTYVLSNGIECYPEVTVPEVLSIILLPFSLYGRNLLTGEPGDAHARTRARARARTHARTHTHTLHRHRRSRCNANITQSAFRELNEPNNCIEHLDAHGAPNLFCLPSAPFHPFIVTKVTILSRTTDLLRISILEDANVFLNRRLY